ncbi:winged helix-turn-helix domain-containing protein [Nonomuraea sp. NPDC000554]|uniref:winged helix-turn-helix domain-containing protein n=1 Tax=Nonomuraea sp. NPDC000554 TaxID=3154259 RepID=UPI003333745C
MIEFAADRPVWKQVADILRGRIRNGSYRPRQPIPSETQLVGEFGIARGTARKVVAALRDEGLIYTVPQMGSFVSPSDGEESSGE